MAACRYCTENDANSTDPCVCKTDCGKELCEAPDARQVIQYRNHTLTKRPDGKVDILANKPGALLVTRDCMEHAVEFVDLWAIPPEDFITKYGPESMVS